MPLWSGHASGVARCHRRVPLQDAACAAVRVVCGHWCYPNVPLQGAGRMCRAHMQGAAKVLREDAVVKVFCALWSGHAAATWCAVLPGVRFGAGILMPLQGAACAMLPGWGVCFGAGKLMPLQGAAWGA